MKVIHCQKIQIKYRKSFRMAYLCQLLCMATAQAVQKITVLPPKMSQKCSIYDTNCDWQWKVVFFLFPFFINNPPKYVDYLVIFK